MELSNFKHQIAASGEITTLDMYMHKGLDWVEHSVLSLDAQFESLASAWEDFSNEEKIEILLLLAEEYKNESASEMSSGLALRWAASDIEKYREITLPPYRLCHRIGEDLPPSPLLPKKHQFG